MRSSPCTSTAPGTGSRSTAAARVSRPWGAGRSSTWPPSSTRTRRTTSPPPATTTPASRTAFPTARSTRRPRQRAFAGASSRRRVPIRSAPTLRRGGPMAEQSFAAALNEQIANEFSAHQQYIGAAVYYDSETLPRLAAFFYRQAVEERNHAMMMVQYLLDASEEVRIPDIESKLTRFDDVVAPVRMALEQEKRVTDEINALFKLARETEDFQAEQFMQWFVKEQVEEVATMTDLLTVVERSSDRPELVEEYLSREALGEEGEDEELYFVQSGRARFEIDAEPVDVPAGTFVFVRPNSKRTAFAEEPETTILAMGATPGRVYEPSGWELWAPYGQLYQEGRYAEAADQARAAAYAHPEYPALLYNVACCESLAGRKGDAIKHLRLALERSEAVRTYLEGDSDLDPLREEPEFQALLDN